MAETGSSGGENWWQGSGLAEWVVQHLHTQKLAGATRARDRPHKPGLRYGKIKPQNLWLKKSVGVEAVGGTPRLTGDFVGETQYPRLYTDPPTWESASRGPNLFVGNGGSYWKLAESWASGIVPSQIPPRHTAPQRSNLGCPAQPKLSTLANT